MEEQYKKIQIEDPKLGEKHVPIVKVEKKEGEIIIDVKIGSVEHPSLSEHFIQWIEVLDGDISLARVYLSPFTKPKAVFVLKEMPRKLIVREFCNLHGTWQYED